MLGLRAHVAIEQHAPLLDPLRQLTRSALRDQRGQSRHERGSMVLAANVEDRLGWTIGHGGSCIAQHWPQAT
jgi:hypothetical protein